MPNKKILLVDGQNIMGLLGDLHNRYDEVVIYGQSNIPEDNCIKVVPLESDIPSFEDFRILTDAVRFSKNYDHVDILSNDEIFRYSVLALSEEITNITVISFEVEKLKDIIPKNDKEKLAYILTLKTKIGSNRVKAYKDALNGENTKISRMLNHLYNEVKLSSSTINYLYDNISNIDITFTPIEISSLSNERDFIKKYLKGVIGIIEK